VKLLADVHMYPPHHNAGAEWMLHSIFRDMIRRGHECHVITHRGERRVYDFEGVSVHVYPTMAERGRLWRACDIGFTHLDRTREAQRCAETFERPLVHIIHNDNNDWIDGPDLAIFNSQHLCDGERARWSKTRMPETIVCRPPVFSDDYRVERGERITLLNLSIMKGGPVLLALAKRMPDADFLGVIGAYGEQTIPSPIPPNVKIAGNTPDVRKVYRETKVLLCPSGYETFGRVAAEAMASGIPVVAHPTPGLRECLDFAGVYLDRSDLEAWEAELRKLLFDPAYYAGRSNLSRLRSAQLDEICKKDLDGLALAIESLAPSHTSA